MRDESFVGRKWGFDNSGEPTESDHKIVEMAVYAASIESGLPPSRIVGFSRLPEICDVRFIVYDMCDHFGNFTKMGLGRTFGRNHGSIINGLRKTKERMQGNESAFRRFRELHARIKKKYKEYENDPERMVQELSLHDGR